MITLKSDNRVLTQNAKYAFLTSNYSSGVSTLNVTATAPYVANDFILIGEMGQENSEIFRIGSISTSGDIVLQTAAGVGATTLYGHPESSKVYKIDYNQVNFYRTAALGTIADETPTFSANTSLSGWLSLTPQSWYTTYNDTTYSTGFGWFVLRNSITLEASTNSNAIPYSGFAAQTVASVFADVDSLLNVTELKLISVSEKFAWVNEALTLLKNKLNLTNTEYTVSTTQTLTIVSGTAEYQLPSDFSDIVEITDGLNTSTTTGGPIPFMSVSKALSYDGDTVFYYLRGRYLGIVPTPTASATYYYRYRAVATRLTSLSDYVTLPDGAFYSLKDFVLYRAKQKLKDMASANAYFQAFTNGVNLYMISAVKRDNDLTSWSIETSSNT